jgi:hypothetical protein
MAARAAPVSRTAITPAFAAGRPEQREQAGRMLELLMAGLRP